MAITTGTAVGVCLVTDGEFSTLQGSSAFVAGTFYITGRKVRLATANNAFTLFGDVRVLTSALAAGSAEADTVYLDMTVDPPLFKIVVSGAWKTIGGGSSGSIDWSQITNVPTDFPPNAHTHNAGDVIAGTLHTDRIPNLDAGKITTGTLADARIPNLDAAKTTTGTFNVARLPNVSLSAETGVGTDKTTPAVSADSIPNMLQTIWSKIRQVANSVGSAGGSISGTLGNLVAIGSAGAPVDSTRKVVDSFGTPEIPGTPGTRILRIYGNQSLWSNTLVAWASNPGSGLVASGEDAHENPNSIIEAYAPTPFGRTWTWYAQGNPSAPVANNWVLDVTLQAGDQLSDFTFWGMSTQTIVTVGGTPSIPGVPAADKDVPSVKAVNDLLAEFEGGGSVDLSGVVKVADAATTIRTAGTATDTNWATEKAVRTELDKTFVVCGDAAATANKVVTIAGFTRVTGQLVDIKFTNGNSATAPTLNISSTGAAAIRLEDKVTAPVLAHIPAGHVARLYFDGTQWIMINPAASTFTPPVVTCSDAAATAGKSVTIGTANAQFNRVTGSTISVIFTSGNSAAAPTLNVNGTGAAGIRMPNGNVPVLHQLPANHRALMMFDGTYWVLMNPVNVVGTHYNFGPIKTLWVGTEAERISSGFPVTEETLFFYEEA